ncbi:MAG: hypothetical protein Q9221_004852 [Calogaya cf. arnoldii]
MRDFSSSSSHQSSSKLPVKQQPSVFNEYVRNAIFSSLGVGAVGYYLLGPEYLTDIWKANKEQPDVFGFVRSQGQIPGYSHESQEPSGSSAQLALDAEKEENERRLMAGAREPDPNSKDPREQLAAYWKDPKNKTELRKWWDKLSYSDQSKYWNIALDLRYNFGVVWEYSSVNPFK